jgi:hypothetical protein
LAALIAVGIRLLLVWTLGERGCKRLLLAIAQQIDFE